MVLSNLLLLLPFDLHGFEQERNPLPHTHKLHNLLNYQKGQLATKLFHPKQLFSHMGWKPFSYALLKQNFQFVFFSFHLDNTDFAKRNCFSPYSLLLELFRPRIQSRDPYVGGKRMFIKSIKRNCYTSKCYKKLLKTLKSTLKAETTWMWRGNKMYCCSVGILV